MARKPKPAFDERELSRGELRKLKALRKSLGNDIADRAFFDWLQSDGVVADGADRNATQIEEALHALIATGSLRIPRGGYVIRRGRGRIIVERPAQD